MAPASSGGHFVLTWCFTGFAAGVGAGALAAVTYSLVPGLSHANVRTGGIPDDFIFLVVAAFGFPAVGAIVGMLSATVCAAPHRRRGLWLGTALGTVSVVLLSYRRLFNEDHQFLDALLNKRG